MIRASPVVVRDATERDIPAIQQVARASWSATYGEIYAAEFIDDFLGRAYSTESLKRSIDAADAAATGHFLVAERDGELVAMSSAQDARKSSTSRS